MKALVLILFTLVPGLAFASDHDASVRGHVRRDGTYVQPHRRTTPDDSARNNWSSTPNVNPWTGAPGKRDPDAIKPPRAPRPDSMPRSRGRSK